MLLDVNELLVAADVARRADDVATVLDAVSLATTTLAPLFLYRTVPLSPRAPAAQRFSADSSQGFFFSIGAARNQSS